MYMHNGYLVSKKDRGGLVRLFGSVFTATAPIPDWDGWCKHQVSKLFIKSMDTLINAPGWGVSLVTPRSILYTMPVDTHGDFRHANSDLCVVALRRAIRKAASLVSAPTTLLTVACSTEIPSAIRHMAELAAQLRALDGGLCDPHSGGCNLLAGTKY